MRADFFPDVGTVKTVSANRDAQLHTAAVKRREAFTRIVTAVLQAGFAIVDTTSYGEAEIQTAFDIQIRSDQDMEACLNGRTWPIPSAHGVVLAASGGVQ